MAQCSVCLSPHRDEIERRLKAKESVRSVSRWLEETHKERIPKSTLYDHMQRHLAVPTKFAEKVFSIPRLVPPPLPIKDENPPSALTLPPLEALALVQDRALQISGRVHNVLTQEQGILLTPQLVTLYLGSLKEARQAAKHRHELVFGKKYVVENQNPRPAALKNTPTDELRERLEILKKRKEASHVE